MGKVVDIERLEVFHTQILDEISNNKDNSAAEAIGDLSKLKTSNKRTIVGAINELYSMIKNINTGTGGTDTPDSGGDTGEVTEGLIPLMNSELLFGYSIGADGKKYSAANVAISKNLAIADYITEDRTIKIDITNDSSKPYYWVSTIVWFSGLNGVPAQEASTAFQNFISRVNWTEEHFTEWEVPENATHFRLLIASQNSVNNANYNISSDMYEDGDVKIYGYIKEDIEPNGVKMDLTELLVTGRYLNNQNTIGNTIAKDNDYGQAAIPVDSGVDVRNYNTVTFRTYEWWVSNDSAYDAIGLMFTDAEHKCVSKYTYRTTFGNAQTASFNLSTDKWRVEIPSNAVYMYVSTSNPNDTPAHYIPVIACFE